MITNGTSAMGLTGSQKRDEGRLSPECITHLEEPHGQWKVITGYKNVIGRDRRAPLSVEQSGLRLVPLPEKVDAPAVAEPVRPRGMAAMIVAMRWVVTLTAEVGAIVKLVVRHRFPL